MHSLLTILCSRVGKYVSICKINMLYTTKRCSTMQWHRYNVHVYKLLYVHVQIAWSIIYYTYDMVCICMLSVSIVFAVFPLLGQRGSHVRRER